MVIHDATEPERLVMEVFPRGNLVDLTNGSRPFDDPSQGERWGQERTVRADVIRHLLTGGVPDERGEVAALHLTGIRIVGILDLAHAHIKYPVYFQRCWFAEPPNLRWALLRCFQLEHSHLPGLRADNATIEGDLALVACSVTRAIELSGARVGGSLNMRSAHITESRGLVLDARQLTVTSNVVMDEGFTAEGEVSLINAHLGGALSLSGARLCNDGHTALDGSRLVVDGPVFCRNGFAAEGAVVLRRARIGGFLDFDRARLSNQAGQALFAPVLAVEGGVYCRESVFEGHVSLEEGRISSSLDLSGAEFRASITCAHLIAPRLTMPRVPISGFVDLSHVRLGVLDAPTESSPGGIKPDGLIYETLEPLLDADKRIRWLNIRDTSYSPQPYEQLASTYRRIGHDADARKVLLARQRHRRRALSLGGKLWGLAQDATTGYGYRPGRAGIWLVSLLLLGTVVFGLQPPMPQKDAPPFNPCFYTLDLLLPILSYGQEGAFRPNGGYQWLAFALITAGWILATCLIAGITRVLHRS